MTHNKTAREGCLCALEKKIKELECAWATRAKFTDLEEWDAATQNMWAILGEFQSAYVASIAVFKSHDPDGKVPLTVRCMDSLNPLMWRYCLQRMHRYYGELQGAHAQLPP